MLWSPPKEENGIITKYVIYYRKKDGSKELNASINTLDWNITGLMPFTNYTIQIEAYTSKGAGNRSSFIDERTKESSRCKYVTNKRVKKLYTGLRVTFTRDQMLRN